MAKGDRIDADADDDLYAGVDRGALNGAARVGKQSTNRRRGDTKPDEKETRAEALRVANDYARQHILPLMNAEIAILKEPHGLFIHEARDGEIGFFTKGQAIPLYQRFDRNIDGVNYEFPVELGNALEWWCKQPERRELQRIVIEPTGAHIEYDKQSVVRHRPHRTRNDEFNLWRGYAIDPDPHGSCEHFWELTRDVICAGNGEKFEWLRKLLALLVQHPEVLWGISIVLHSKQGAGKDLWVAYLYAIFGRHLVTVTEAEEITGRFTGHLAPAIVLFANEALWHGGRKSQEGFLKAMITDARVRVERKGKDAIYVDNYRHVIVASNDDFAVPIGPNDRRYVYFEVSNERINDTPFYDAILCELRNCGAAALLYELFAIDIRGFNPRERPRGAHSSDLQSRSFGSIDQFIETAINDDELRFEDEDARDEHGRPTRPIIAVPWEGEHSRNDLVWAYRLFCKHERLRPERRQALITRMRERGVAKDGPRRRLKYGERDRKMLLPSRADAIAAFCKDTGQDPDSFDRDDEADDKPAKRTDDESAIGESIDDLLDRMKREL